MTIGAISAIKRVEIDHRDSVDDEPRKVISGSQSRTSGGIKND